MELNKILAFAFVLVVFSILIVGMSKSQLFAVTHREDVEPLIGDGEKLTVTLQDSDGETEIEIYDQGDIEEIEEKLRSLGYLE